jgi:glutamine cyclotransferase
MSDEDEATTKRKTTQLPKMDWLIEQGIINIGDEVYLINNPEEIAVVVDSKNVEYKGKVMSFNQFGCELTGWKAIQIYTYMKKVGGSKTLAKLRKEKMSELGMLN